VPKYTLLELVQKTATVCSLDEVNDINDTQDSLDIVSLAEDTYFEIINHRDWDHLNTLITASSSGDNTKPNYLKLGDRVRELLDVSYNVKKVGDTREKFKSMKWKEPDAFLATANTLNSDADNVTTITDYSGVPYNIRTDVAPTYYTTFDDEWLVFDSYDSDIDSTLQTSKSQLRVIREPVWEAANDFVPDLPIDGFPLLLSELKSVASVVMRQEPNQKEEQKSQRQARRMSGKNFKVNDLQRVPNYGRK
jgi:hypothetical protein